MIETKILISHLDYNRDNKIPARESSLITQTREPNLKRIEGSSSNKCLRVNPLRYSIWIWVRLLSIVESSYLVNIKPIMGLPCIKMISRQVKASRDLVTWGSQHHSIWPGTHCWRTSQVSWKAPISLRLRYPSIKTTSSSTWVRSFTNLRQVSKVRPRRKR